MLAICHSGWLLHEWASAFDPLTFSRIARCGSSSTGVVCTTFHPAFPRAGGGWVSVLPRELKLKEVRWCILSGVLHFQVLDGTYSWESEHR